MRRHPERDEGRVLAAFWAAVDLCRPLVLGYVVWLYAQRIETVEHPERGWVILGVLAVWTALTLVVRRRTRWWLSVELVIAAGAVLASGLVDSRAQIEAGAATVPGMWPAATVISWGILAGPIGGTLAAVVIAAADLVLVGVPNDATVHNIVILLLLGALIGYCAELSRDGQRALREAAELQARTAERERLARSVHDGVLQTLSLVHRRGLELGGDFARLGHLAADQERSLRELIRSPVPSVGTRPEAVGDVDLATLLGRYADAGVTVADTGEVVVMPADRARELEGAVAAALDNVARHAGEGARSWILLERIGGEVVVTVRDNGAGFLPGRLEEAREQGRLGVCASIVGRMRDLGGSAQITSGSAGTTVELRAPVAGAGAAGGIPGRRTVDEGEAGS